MAPRGKKSKLAIDSLEPITCGGGGTSSSSGKNVDTATSSAAISNALAIFDEMDKSYTGFKARRTKIDIINSGSPFINKAIGIGGYPRGRIMQLYGPQGSGKTFLSMIAIANMIKQDPTAVAAWFDAEHSFNYDWAKKLGIWDEDSKKSHVKVFAGTRGVDIIERIVGKRKKDKFGTKKVQNGLLDYVIAGKLNCPIIVIDSLGSIVAPREEDAVVGGLTVGALAGFLNSELKRMTGIVEEANCLLICLNQVRQSLDAGQYGEKFHFPGGESLKHQMSLNIYIERKTGQEDLITLVSKDKNTLIGQKVKIVIKKNRFGPAPRATSTTLLFTEGAGYDKIGIVNADNELVDIAIDAGIILREDSWYTVNNERCQGVEQVLKYLKNNPEVFEEIKQQINNTTLSTNAAGVEEILDDDNLDELLDYSGDGGDDENDNDESSDE